MSTLFILLTLVVFAAIVGIWWYIYLGQVNPPLQRATVSVQSVSTPGIVASDTVVTSTIDPADVTGANPPLTADQLSIDSAVFNVEVASTGVEQARGLSYRSALGDGDGMLFLFGTGSVQTFWMKDMNFPLDMIWISGDTVDGFAQDVPAPAPGTQLWQLPLYASPDNTDKVLEVNAGTVAKYNIKVGDSVIIGPIQ